MIQKLRRKIIAISMAAIAGVLLIILGVVNLINYRQTDAETRQRMAILVEFGGTLPEAFDGRGRGPAARPESDTPPDGTQPPADGEYDFRRRGLSEETPYEMRFFTVTIKGGDITATDLTRIASVTEDQAKEYAYDLWKKGNTDGTEGYYQDFRYHWTEQEDGTQVLFLDCSRERSTVRRFLLASALISGIGLIIVFALVLVFSRRAVKPFAENYEKQRRFITDAGHELKTPLAIINADVDVLEMDYGESEWTNSIKSQTGRLSELTSRLIFLARMEEDSPQITLIKTDFSALAEEACESFRPLAKSRALTLTQDIERNLFVNGDKAALRELINILIDNAVKYASENGTIEARLGLSGKSLLFTVENTASGIVPGPHPEFFERFYRADASRNSATGGSGIGLSAAAAVVRVHKGKITAEAPDETRIVFTVTLPLWHENQ